MGSHEDGNDRMNMLTRESVAAIYAMTCSADLEARIRVVSEREGLPDDQLIPFFIVMPEGYDDNERKSWIKSVTAALTAVATDAHSDIMVDRTIKTMMDLGLGDDGNGNFRE